MSKIKDYCFVDLEDHLFNIRIREWKGVKDPIEAMSADNPRRMVGVCIYYNVEDDDEKKEKEYKIDGKYYAYKFVIEVPLLCIGHFDTETIHDIIREIFKKYFNL